MTKEPKEPKKPKGSKATVGRIVHYISYGSAPDEEGNQKFKSECRAAMITEVLSPSVVNLCVLNPTGLFFNEGLFLDEDASRPAGSWHWPERK